MVCHVAFHNIHDLAGECLGERLRGKSRVWTQRIHLATVRSVGERIPPELRREVGERIRARRIDLGLSTTQLGRMLENAKGNAVERTQVARWERGVNLPAQRYWIPLATALRLEVGQLFAGLADEVPEWIVTLSNRVEALEHRLEVLARLLGLEEAVAAVGNVPRLSPQQREEWAQAAEELEAQSEQSEVEEPASESRAASG